MVEKVCSFIQSNSNNANISNNAAGCETLAQVQTACNPCPPGNVTLTSQAEVNAFVAQYPNCTVINGNLIINGFNITNLSGLSNLTSVTGELLINITINNNINVTGLQNMSSVGDKLSIYRIGNLTNVNFLSGLTNVGSIEISNQILTNIQGLSNITGTLSGGISISGCDNLTSLNGLQNITSLGGSLNITSNQLLTDLTGLQGLTSINNTIGGVYNLWIFNNANLSSLNGLNNLTLFTKSPDPNNLTTTGFGLFSNPNLTNINALSSISNILDLIAISNNSQLETCAINPICNKLLITTSGVNISGNATGCQSVAAVSDACQALNTNAIELASNVVIYPNPFHDQLQLQFQQPIEGVVTLLDITGKVYFTQMVKGTNHTLYHLGHLSKGVYVLQVQTNQGETFMQKLVK